MPRRLWLRVGLVVLVFVASIWYLYPPKHSINLGLDLQGGIHLMLGVEVDKYVASQTSVRPRTSRTGSSVRAWPSSAWPARG